jgi:ubiquitin-conjugating enzyme E2 O
LDVDDAANRTRPPRFWVGSDISKLTLVRGKADAEMRVGDRVNLKNTEDLPMTEHGNEKEPAGIVHVQTFKVTDTETTIDILWQDGEKETVRSVDVIPYVSPDEYDCW